MFKKSNMLSFLVKKLWLGIVIAGIAITLSCNVSRQSSKEDEAIAESIFRYQIEHVRLRNLPQQYFLSLGDSKDPADEFLKKFDGSPYPVKRYSESVYQNGLITERKTGQRGIQLEVKSIKWLSDNEVEVEGSWFAGHENYQEQIFRAHKEHGIWSVKSVKGVLDP
jgi:hypothetical protein